MRGTYLWTALRRYLVRQLTGPRCADSVTEPAVGLSFNARLRSQNQQRDPVALLADHDMAPAESWPPRTSMSSGRRRTPGDFSIGSWPCMAPARNRSP